MMYFRFAGNNEAELAGNHSDWTDLMQALLSGTYLFPLSEEIAPYPYDHTGKLIRIDLVDDANISKPTGRFYTDHDTLVFLGTVDDVNWLTAQIAALLGAPPGTHFHIDVISFSERLVDNTLDLVFHLDGAAGGWGEEGPR